MLEMIYEASRVEEWNNEVKVVVSTQKKATWCVRRGELEVEDWEEANNINHGVDSTEKMMQVERHNLILNAEDVRDNR